MIPFLTHDNIIVLDLRTKIERAARMKIVGINPGKIFIISRLFYSTA